MLSSPTMRYVLLSFLCLFSQAVTFAQDGQPELKAGDELVAEYFELETARIEKACWEGIETLADWQAKRGESHEQLLEMLGLMPLPERTDLEAQITGQLEREGVIVENIHFQSMPGLYVTANLYRPAGTTEALPAILYVCGHGKVVKDGVSYGNKVHYQHHGAWFAKNGYVCLTIDSVQLGELEGIHHGTHRYNMWWWNSRGYTPAGAEAWNCVRALDYLQTRKEVDPERIGVTGRSGGGAYSWWIAAIDERVKAAVPVAGITSLRNHVVDDCVEGHCDCMFMVNTYRWDFAKVAALVAPRPLLISNTDKDRIFPLDGVVDVHSQVRRIYELYNANDKLGLHITEGPHKDTQELRIHAFRWFNRFLRETEEPITIAAEKLFEPEELKVFDELPEVEITTSVHETLVPKFEGTLADSESEARQRAEELRSQLKEHTFGAWPKFDSAMMSHDIVQLDGYRVVQLELKSQAPFQLPLILVSKDDSKEKVERQLHLRILDDEEWQAAVPKLLALEEGAALPEEFQAICTGDTTVFFGPRGVGPTAWTGDDRESIHIRRRFMLLGQTLASAQVYDVCLALKALNLLKNSETELNVVATGSSGVVALYAALMQPKGVARLELVNLPVDHRSAPDLLNVSRFSELRDVVAAVGLDAELEFTGETQSAWKERLDEKVERPWLRIQFP